MFTGCHEGERVGEEAPRIRSATGGRRGKPAASLRDLEGGGGATDFGERSRGCGKLPTTRALYTSDAQAVVPLGSSGSTARAVVPPG